MIYYKFENGLKKTAIGFFLATALSISPMCAQDQAAPDNSKVNKTDAGQNPSADNAKNKTSDVKMMGAIRREIVHDKSLSTYGHNVKVVARHGKVTLKGPVHSDEEKKTIEQYAEKIAGAGNVTDELTVKSDQKQ